MPDLLHFREGLTMAIKRVVSKLGGTNEHMVVPEFAFATNVGAASTAANTGDLLANMILDAWANVDFTYTPSTPPGAPAKTVPLGNELTKRDYHTHLPTQDAVDCATQYVQNIVGLNLTRAVVITEAEHDNDYILQSADEIAFVLPDITRVVHPTPFPPPPYPADLLATAEFLMACTPNGI
jgi:hypothetical protein